MRRISPTNDLAFKKVLASNENKDILRGFIGDFFGIMPNELIIENPYSINDYKEVLNHEETSVLRQTLRDITASMIFADITMELQIRKTTFFDERSLYYPFDRYCQNFNKQGDMKADLDGKFNRFSSLKPIYALNILGYTHFQDEEALRIFELFDPKRQKSMNKELLKIGFFELTKSNIETMNQKHWRDYFIKGIVLDNAPDYIKKASEIIEFPNLGKEEQDMAIALEKARALYEEELVDSFVEGETSKATKIAANMLKEGLQPKEVAKYSELPLDAVMKIKQDLLL